MRLHILFFSLFSLLLATVSMAASSAEPKSAPESAFVSQGDLAVLLTKTLHWDGGLPEEPKASDYLAIFDGKRSYRFEAEDIYSVATDSVSVRSFNIFGPFSGRGWVSGITVPTKVHLNLYVPLDGEYLLNVAAKGDGQVWNIADKTFTLNSGNGFSEKEVGKVVLKGGKQEITVVIPPEGAIDYLKLTAPKLKTIEPYGGWHFQAPVKRGDIAKIAVALLDLEGSLGSDTGAAPLTFVAATAGELPPAASVTSVEYLGSFTAKQWVRAGYQESLFEMPLIVEQEGVYGIKVNYLGTAFSATLDDRNVTCAGKPYFTWLDLGLFSLSRGRHKLVFQLSPSDGIDVVQLEKKKSSPADLMSLAGIDGTPDAPLKQEDLDTLIKSIAARFTVRK